MLARGLSPARQCVCRGDGIAPAGVPSRRRPVRTVLAPDRRPAAGGPPFGSGLDPPSHSRRRCLGRPRRRRSPPSTRTATGVVPTPAGRRPPARWRRADRRRPCEGRAPRLRPPFLGQLARSAYPVRRGAGGENGAVAHLTGEPRVRGPPRPPGSAAPAPVATASSTRSSRTPSPSWFTCSRAPGSQGFGVGPQEPHRRPRTRTDLCHPFLHPVPDPTSSRPGNIRPG